MYRCNVSMSIIYESEEQTHAAIERVREIASDELGKIGERLRESLVIPFCDRNKLAFLSGNGAWWFFNAGTYDEPELDMFERDTLEGIKLVLSIPDNITGMDIGCYVRDYEPE